MTRCPREGYLRTSVNDIEHAHGRISGNPQKTEMQITGLESSQRIGSLTTKVLDEI